MARGWVGGHIGAAWDVFYVPVWLMAVPLQRWGPICAHSKGGANTQGGGEIRRHGELEAPTAPSA